MGGNFKQPLTARDRRHIKLMLETVLNYEKRHIRLGAFINDLSILINTLQSVDPIWQSHGRFVGTAFKNGTLVEISSAFNELLKIENLDGKVIWQRGD
ncbi:MAG: hypothetical protein LBV79_11995 [Candidatus Adiutrix sp.]|nr:hypothetical protein [Candidatus Adiutrix sp.]